MRGQLVSGAAEKCPVKGHNLKQRLVYGRCVDFGQSCINQQQLKTKKKAGI